MTADGSPSLRIADATGYVEKMHHTDGALSESLYIYGDAIEETLKRGWPLKVVSLGLGLGYNELIVAAVALQHEAPAQSTTLHSFEIEPLLSRSFLDWTFCRSSEFGPLYDQILQQLSQRFQMESGEIQAWLKKAFDEGRWQIRSRFPEDANDVSEISCLLYDAFSNKMSPELWSEELITSQLNQICAEACVFSTYAATGALNRALKKTGFERIDRRGFSGKRESTFAIRGRKV
jgi:tRNA U34 5-methylaminomethyl-2-thiouridine-forming methyltransferase MnmC